MSATDEWRIHVLGCVRLVRKADVAVLEFDGRHFGWDMCDRLLVGLERLRGLTSSIEFRVFAGSAAGKDGWIRHAAADVAQAQAFVRLVATVVTASDEALRIRTASVKLERLLMERRGVFDEVLAAWLLDRDAGSPTLARLFEPSRDKTDEGLKLVRRFGDNLTFDAYRAPVGHQWVEDQRSRMVGADLGAVLDRRLARSLLGTIIKTQHAGQPQLEHVTGVFLTDRGHRFGEYYRLSLPLDDREAVQGAPVLVATQW